jgi:hypothetical protein
MPEVATPFAMLGLIERLDQSAPPALIRRAGIVCIRPASRYPNAARCESEGRAHPAQIRADQLRPGALGRHVLRGAGIDRRY